MSWCKRAVIAALLLATPFGCVGYEKYLPTLAGSSVAVPKSVWRDLRPLKCDIGAFDSSTFSSMSVENNLDMKVDAREFGPAVQNALQTKLTAIGTFSGVTVENPAVADLVVEGTVQEIGLRNNWGDSTSGWCKIHCSVSPRVGTSFQPIQFDVSADAVGPGEPGSGKFSPVLDPLSDQVAQQIALRVLKLPQLQELADSRKQEPVSPVTSGSSSGNVVSNGEGATPLSHTSDPNTLLKSAGSQLGRRFAVVIGLSQYADSRIPSLRYAEDDARAFAQWLTSEKGGRYAASDVKLLLGKEATCAAMRQALFGWLKQSIEEDVVTIYFSGHGTPESPDQPENLFLVPYDTNFDQIAATAFPMWDVETALKRFIRAKRVIVIADACHAGGVGSAFTDGTRALTVVGAVNDGIQNLASANEGVAVLSSAGNKQLSLEAEKWGGGHGVFTYYLLKGLSGDADYGKTGVVTLGELIPYLSEKVRRETNSAQAPEVSGKFDPALSIGK